MSGRHAFEAALQALQDDVLVLGDRVENALLDSIDALKARDFEASRAIIA